MNKDERRFVSPKDIYREVDYLGGGQTADVYRVRRQSDDSEWALKLLRAPEYQARFFNEVITLRLLKHAPHLTFQTNAHPLVPEVVDSQEEGTERFFVMTLAQGRPLDEVLREQGVLAERDALYILAQVASVFQALHEQLRRSYLDFQPRNVFWDERTRRVIVLDWNLLSREGEIDAPGDILTLGKLLYWMAVGAPLPSAGVTAAEDWAKVTLGTQQILRQATHSNLDYRYASIDKFYVACTEQLKLWEIPANDLFTKGSELLDRAALSATNVQENRRLIAEAHNHIQILEQRQDELGGYLKTSFPGLKQKASEGWQASTLFATGLRFLKGLALEQAQECFTQLYVESGDLAEKLRAARWLLVAQMLDANRRQVMHEACSLLDEHRLDAALTTLDGARPAREKDSLADLRRDVEAHLAWQAAQELTTRAGVERQPDLYRQAAARLAEVQAHIAQLPERHRPLLAELWGDLQQQQDNLTQQAQALAARSTDLDTLRKELSGLSRQEIVSRVKKELEQQPGDPGLVALGLDEARQWLVKLATAPAIADLVKDVQNLLDSALIHASRQTRPALLAEWRTAAALQQLLHLLERSPVDIQRIEQQLDALAVNDPSITQLEALRYLSEQMLLRAEHDLDPALAQLAAATAQRANLVTTSALGERAAGVQQALQGKLAERRQRIHDRIKQLAGETSAAGMAEALSLLKWQLSNDEDDPERSHLEEQRWSLEERKAAQQDQQEADIRSEVFNAEFRKLRESVIDPDDPQQLNMVAEDLTKLGQQARAQQVDALAAQCDEEAHKLHARSQHLTQLQALLAEVTQIFQEYERVPKAVLALRDARIHMLYAARQKLDEADQFAVKTTALHQLRQQVDDAWQNENATFDPVNPDSPLHALQKLEQLDLVRPQIEELPNPQALADVQDRITDLSVVLQRWNRTLWPLLVALLLLGLATVGLGVRQFLRPQDASGQTVGLNELRSQLSTRIEEMGNLVTGVLDSKAAIPVSTLAGQVAALATRVDGVATPISALSDQMTTLTRRVDTSTAPLTNLPDQVAQLATQVDAVGAAVNELNARTTAPAPAANSIPTPTPDLAATEQASAATLEALRAPLNATATAQTALAANLAATEQALTTRTAELENRATSPAVAPAAPAAQATAGVTATNDLTNTPSSSLTTPATNTAISITFPVSGTAFYIAPWVVEVTARAWLNNVTAYRLSLNDVLLNIFGPVVEGDTHTYRRNITGDFDDFFPSLSENDKTKLGLDTRNQLPPGRYTLRLDAVVVSSQFTELHRVDFIIRNHTEAVVASNQTGDPLIRRRETRTNPQSRLDDRSLTPRADALILGKAVAPFDNPETPQVEVDLALWCYWEAVDDPRRGWTLCRYLTLQTGERADQVAEQFTDLLPSP